MDHITPQMKATTTTISTPLLPTSPQVKGRVKTMKALLLASRYQPYAPRKIAVIGLDLTRFSALTLVGLLRWRATFSGHFITQAICIHRCFEVEESLAVSKALLVLFNAMVSAGWKACLWLFEYEVPPSITLGFDAGVLIDAKIILGGMGYCSVRIVHLW
jgi:hypothetical protein